MSKLYFISILILFPFSNFCQDLQEESSSTKSLYQYAALDIDGDSFYFSSLKGKKLILINTATKCMFAPQISELQKLYESYQDKGVVVVAFPCNDFANREPKGNNSVKKLCLKKYGVTFPLMSKVSVKGDDMHPVYQYLTQKELNGFSNNKVEWNFQKFLVNEKGYLVMIISPRKSPFCDEIVEWIENE
ncbi:MAG: glutathione peroxidase [Bacteroidetes bacterium]|nr:glutathione peroxidase [Bacteroidota bacterium]